MLSLIRLFFVTCLVGSSFGGFIDADILRILLAYDNIPLYVVSPVHFLPSSVLTTKFYALNPIEKESIIDVRSNNKNDGKTRISGPDTITVESSEQEPRLNPPESEYGPPKSENDKNREYLPPKNEKLPPKNEELAPNNEYLPPKTKPEYGPPKEENKNFEPIEIPSFIYKSYVEPTFSFGQLPLIQLGAEEEKKSQEIIDKFEKRSSLSDKKEKSKYGVN